MSNEWMRKLSWIIYWVDRCSDSNLPGRYFASDATQQGSQDAAAVLDLETLLRRDMQDIRERLIYMHQMLESAFAAITGVSQTLQSSVSIDEARLARNLSIAALIFVPLALTSGILSMGGEFAPGGSLFWVYFVVAIPLTICTLILWKSMGGAPSKADTIQKRFRDLLVMSPASSRGW
jgi:protein-S-isoprenylcysteine O-methyltransferase Ste14